MKILIFAQDFKPNSGGIAEYTHQIARELQCRGHEICVVCPPLKSKQEAEDVSLGYPVLRQHWPLGPFGLLIRVLQRISLVRKQQADVLFMNALHSDPMANFTVSKLLRIPIAIAVYGMEIKHRYPLLRQLELRMIFRHIDGLVAASKYAREQAEALTLGKTKAQVVYPCCDRDSFDKSVFPEGQSGKGDGQPLVFFSLCRHVRRKGLDKALLAFARVSREWPDCMYLIGGEGPDTPRLKRLAEQLDLEGKVVFLGRLSEKEKEKRFADAFCFVMPSRELPDGDVEGFGIVYLEAAKYGVPSIGGDSGGVPEAVLHEQTGLLASPPTHRKIAECMRRLLHDRDLRDTMGLNAQRRLATELNIGIQADRLVEFFEQLIASKRKKSAS